MSSAVLSFFKNILPFVKSEAEKVAPEVQAQINALLGEAQSKVAALKANTSVAALRAQMESDIQAVKDTASHHIDLITKFGDAQIAKAQATVPVIQSPTPPGPTAVTS